MLDKSEIIFDECDRHIIESCNWHPHASGKTIYARSADKRYLHRVIICAPDGVDVDHINGNGLDVRRANLRMASRSQNNMNRRSQRAGRKGVHFESSTGRWRGEIFAFGTRYRSQRFPTEAEAIAWRENMEAQHHGQFAGSGTEQCAMLPSANRS